MTKREAIIQATIETVAEKGLAESPTILLAKRAGAAELTLFRLFGSKNDLLTEAYDEVLKRFSKVCELADIDKYGIEAKLKNILWVAVGYYRERPEELAFGLRYSVSPAGEFRRTDFRSETGEDTSGFPIVSLLLQGRETGFFKKLPISVLSGLAIYPIISLLREEYISKAMFDEQELELVIETTISAIKK